MGDRLRLWVELVTKIMSVELGDQDDSFIWCLTKHASFTVKSMYSDLMKIGYLPDRCVAWDLKIPLKIKNILWYLKKRVILTKDNLAKRNWKGDTKCCFCSSNEAIMRLYNIYSLIIMWLGSFGMRLRRVWYSTTHKYVIFVRFLA